MLPRRSPFMPLIAAICMALLLSACSAGIDPAYYADQKPVLDLKQFFNGRLQAHGMFQDRSGKVIKRFEVVIDCQWQGDTGTLDEHFTYADGTTQRRVWTLTKTGPDRYSGRADDVVGEAIGITSGNTLHWNYVLALPVGDKVYNVNFDDLMVLMNERVMLNRAVMSKFGIHLGDITLSFYKR